MYTYMYIRVSDFCSCNTYIMCSPSSLPIYMYIWCCRMATLMLRKCLQPSLHMKAFV